MAGTQTCRPRGAALQQTAENGEQCFQNPIANPAGQRQQHDLHEQHVQHHEFEETRRGRPAQPGYSLCTARVNRQEVLGVVQFESAKACTLIRGHAKLSLIRHEAR